MSERSADLHMLNVVVANMAASVSFYRRLGVAVGDDLDTSAPHVQLRLPGGFSLELDTADSARLWHAGWRADAASVGVVVGFALVDRQAVDDTYAELTAAGYRGRQPPFDAFWGARYAIVADPDGNDVGLMSPIDDSRRTWPPQESPAP
ncbi:MAG TPA: VOC family protein [Acidimicrobiales bacterium]|nr:VOC family protein [Acidimicrobiales bacterium]